MVGMHNKTLSLWVGLFMLMGMLALLVLALKVSGLTNYVGGQGYLVTANFDNIGDLKPRAPVTVAGVRIGQVTRIDLDKSTFKAVVTMQIARNQNVLPKDSSASIYTQGLLGSNYIGLSPGFDQAVLHNGDKIEDTHSALILENLIGQFIYKLNAGEKTNTGEKK
jgi:phospholipid/cholesterol/gamma-HCH transport system substrate-binding protein